jgi:hypothetical protein
MEQSEQAQRAIAAIEDPRRHLWVNAIDCDAVGHDVNVAMCLLVRIFSQ